VPTTNPHVTKNAIKNIFFIICRSIPDFMLPNIISQKNDSLNKKNAPVFFKLRRFF